VGLVGSDLCIRDWIGLAPGGGSSRHSTLATLMRRPGRWLISGCCGSKRMWPAAMGHRCPGEP
jgi:hypothetical protein